MRLSMGLIHADIIAADQAIEYYDEKKKSGDYRLGSRQSL